MNIPKDFPAKDLTINIAFADFDVDRWLSSLNVFGMVGGREIN